MTSSSSTSVTSSISSHATPGSIFYQEDSDPADCPDEEECEINWDLMPGYNDNDTDTDDDEKKKVKVVEEKEKTQSASSSSSASYSSSSYSSYVRPPVPQPVKRSIEKSRVLLEMNWQLEECVVDAETCTDLCADCAGSGQQWCHFCRGTRLISFIVGNGGDSDSDSEFRTCLLCRTDGHIVCSICAAGIGNISPWAATYDKQKEGQ